MVYAQDVQSPRHMCHASVNSSSLLSSSDSTALALTLSLMPTYVPIDFTHTLCLFHVFLVRQTDTHALQQGYGVLLLDGETRIA